VTLSVHSVRGCTLLAGLALGALFAAIPAEARTFNASPKDVKHMCGGTYMGVNKSGSYGCINKINVVLCKKGKCEIIKTRVAPPGKDGEPGGTDTGGNDTGGGGSGGAGATGGVSSTNNAGNAAGGGGGTIN